MPIAGPLACFAIELIHGQFTSLSLVKFRSIKTPFSIPNISNSAMDTLKNSFQQFGDTVSRSTFGRVFRLEGSGHVRASDPIHIRLSC